MPSTKAQVIVWVFTLLTAGRLAYVAFQHDVPIIDTVAIGLLAAYGFKAGLENVATSIRRARQGVER